MKQHAASACFSHGPAGPILGATSPVRFCCGGAAGSSWAEACGSDGDYVPG
eukprot:CAMPEP_0179031678 /NCGR_PEP_ID=MMETSP0796-20121207/11194_1 /TAXON_ID=73915 /ORGANISM="Pyrodinium bahamense, Strain pbaha01" /LENGTH=50 /DNA_ID=CAMNT_0020727877 /DNA_START=93 /DNA_END=241 /DNA_ORIENTATION=+